MQGLTMTLALEHYDRHLPLLQGDVRPASIDLKVLNVRTDDSRHERMIRRREWDACELSLSSYIMAKTRGAPLTAIPVFSRRLYSQSQMYVNTGAGIASPRDLIGKRVGLRSYQTTLSVLAKGDLSHDYSLPLDQVTWVTSTDEPVAFQPPPAVRIERAPDQQSINTMLERGDIQALMVPRMPPAFVQGSPWVARLFPDPRDEEMAYFRRNGFFPIMHLLAVKEEIVDRHPRVCMELFQAFEQAKQMAYSYYNDPNWSHLAWASSLQREERQVMGQDPWPNGLAKNRKNLERFIQYELDQGLIDRKLEVEELFAEPTWRT